jgi:hypothetical protein
MANVIHIVPSVPGVYSNDRPRRRLKHLRPRGPEERLRRWKKSRYEYQTREGRHLGIGKH